MDYILCLDDVEDCDIHAAVSCLVYHTTFNNTSIIFCESVVLVEATGVHCENPRPSSSH